VQPKPTFLLRKGRVLTPHSRLRYRLLRLRTLRTAGLDLDEFVAVGSLALRSVSLPFVVAFDYLAWPVVRRTLGRGQWTVVKVQFHGLDAEMVRVAWADTEDDARRVMQKFTHAPP
jgi:hypothetical protein